MNLTDKNMVIDFLRKKKLSYPLYKEVHDHFLTDIEQKMTEGLGFQEAFLQVKIKWQKEFQLVSQDILSFRKVPLIEQRLLGNIFDKIVKSSVLFSILTILFLLVYPPLEFYILGAGFGVLTIYAFYLLFNKKIKFSQFIQINFHPLVLRYIILCIVVFVFLQQFQEIFYQSINIKDSLKTVLMAFNISIQLQLLRLHEKKINVLIND